MSYPTKATVTPTPLASLSPLLAKLKQTFQSGKTKDVEFRKTQLKQFWKLADVSEATYWDIRIADFVILGK